MTVSRRRLLALTGAAAGLPRLARGAPASRTVALDWGLAATAIGLGAPPVGLAEQRLYAEWVGTPAVPRGTVEVGLRVTPSLETIARLAPDLILVNGLNAGLAARLRAIAPTYGNMIFAEERRPLERAAATARDLGGRLGRSAAAEELIAATERSFAGAAARLDPQRVGPVLPLAFADARHLTLYGRGSLIDGVLARLALASPWSGPTNLWGFALQPIEALETIRDATLLVIEPVPPAAQAALVADGLWTALAAANRNRVVILPPFWTFGDLTATRRAARLVADALAPAAGTRS